jgi:hypothetical protein
MNIPIIKIRNYGNKLASDMFVHVAAVKKSVKYPLEVKVVDPETNDEHRFWLFDRIYDRTVKDIESIFTMMSHQVMPKDFTTVVPGLNPDTPLVINVFKRI